MALGVEDMRAGRVVLKATLLTIGTLGFTFCLTLLFLSMRSVMDVGGFCASGGPYEIRTACPQNVGWLIPVSIFGALLFVGISVVAAFSQGGPRPYAFAWSALFLALGWNFLQYGFDPPDGGTSASWLVCGVDLRHHGWPAARVAALEVGRAMESLGATRRAALARAGLVSPHAGKRHRIHAERRGRARAPATSDTRARARADGDDG